MADLSSSLPLSNPLLPFKLVAIAITRGTEISFQCSGGFCSGLIQRRRQGEKLIFVNAVPEDQEGQLHQEAFVPLTCTAMWGDGRHIRLHFCRRANTCSARVLFPLCAGHQHPPSPLQRESKEAPVDLKWFGCSNLRPFPSQGLFTHIKTMQI